MPRKYEAESDAPAGFETNRILHRNPDGSISEIDIPDDPEEPESEVE